MTITIDGQLQRGGLHLDLCVDIEPGLTTITGPNGAGKTTLLRLIAGLERLDVGRLSVNGRVVDDRSAGMFLPAFERGTAVVFQEHRLFDHLSLLDNVAFPIRRSGARRSAARATARLHVEALGLADVAHLRAPALSLGQRQRTAFARALAAKTDVLLLDEPLASIDAASREAIRQHVDTLDHRFVLWVTHDPVDAERGDHRINVIDGHVVQNQSQ